MQLSINVRGELVSTNFDAWKQELIAQIRSVNTDLATDTDFALAELSVKRFKSAENALKAAKSSAIAQAPDIFDLFTAIDQVSEEVRSVRLTLERQIRQRKIEIKSQLIDSSIDRIRAYVARQESALRSIDTSDYLDRHNFEEAAKRRSTVQTLVTALNELCSRIERQIDDRAVLVHRNDYALNALTEEQQLLFPDRARLLGIPAAELDRLIDERLANWRRRMSSAGRTSQQPQGASDESASFQASEIGEISAPPPVESALEGPTEERPDLPGSAITVQGGDFEEAAQILEALMTGCDPFSGEVLPRDSIISDPRVQQALDIAIRVLRSSQDDTLHVGMREGSGGSNVSDVAFAEFNVRLRIDLARFLSPGWFYVGETVAKCPHCMRHLQGMRKPYMSSGRKYHYWALICVACKEAYEPRQLEVLAREALYASSRLRPGPSGET